MADVFISYRKADRAKAEKLAKAFKVENIDVWWDEGLEAGQTFDEKIQSVLEQAKAVVVVWSKESVKSEWVRAESSVGRERGILVPVMIQPVNIPVPFNLIHTANLIGWNGDRAHKEYQEVVKQVKTLAGKQHVKPRKPPPNGAIRALWRAVAAVAVIAAIGASTWFIQPWKWADPEFRAAQAAEKVKSKLEASRAQLAPFGVQIADFDTMTGHQIAASRFRPETYEQLKTLAGTGEPAALALLCAVEQWGWKDRETNQDAAGDVCPKAAEAGDPAGHLFSGDNLTWLPAYVGAVDEEKTEMSATAEYKKASDAGSAWGDIEYGIRLEQGKGGLTANPAQAAEYFKKAQAKGLPAGDYYLGLSQLAGLTLGTTVTDAVAMMTKAADAGYDKAQFDLCDRFVGGYNLTEDLDAALKYCKMAASSIDPQISVRAERLIPDVERRIAERDAAKTGQPAPAPN
jgi:TPR repeat protein